MVENINRALSAHNYDEKISQMNEVFVAVKEQKPQTRVYKPVLEKIKEERIPLRSIPVLAEDKIFRGEIAQKIRNLD